MMEVKSCTALGPDVLRTIFKMLPTKDLLTCSMVSQQWYVEARAVLQHLRTCHANLTDGDPCTSLMVLNKDIASMRSVPFTAMRLKMHKVGEECTCGKSGGVADRSDYLNILDLPLKRLEVTFYRSHFKNANCMVNAFVSAFCERTQVFSDGGGHHEPTEASDLRYHRPPILVINTRWMLKSEEVEVLKYHHSMCPNTKELVLKARNQQRWR